MFSDPTLNQLIGKYPAPKFKERSDFLFEDLIESIISQQLSIKASDTIFKRFKQIFVHRGVTEVGNPVKNFPTPQEVLAIDDQSFRNCGISFQKFLISKVLPMPF